MINRILIANRGEIACRVMRTARELGIETVAVYADADRRAQHVLMADHAVHIGASEVGASYLDADKIISAAQTTDSDAIHPGYGFLSENANFAAACKAAGLRFIGPSPEAIELMGDKAAAKRAMIAAEVPCVPGYQSADQSAETLTAEAMKIGLPVMIKAAAGGGGRGMRLVTDASQLESGITTARSEAENAFGNGELILEKAIQRPRHVEIQVFGDTHGNVIYLGERDCSVQRRHQKIIEEAPCPIMTAELRRRMGEAAVAAARAVDYVGAGTVEFLLDESGEFYFLEMNTRLQVEHPVTELVTGLDLVSLQIAVANGEALPLSQDEVELTGHAIEIRLYAEDPRNDFLPATGKVADWRIPAGPGVRVDAGIAGGDEVSPYYDPMLAKVIASGPDRESARRCLVRALSGSSLTGVPTNRDFLIDALGRDDFINGTATTAFIENEYGDAGFTRDPATIDYCLAALAQHKLRGESARVMSPGVNPELMDWSSTGVQESVVVYRSDEDRLTFLVRTNDGNTFSVLHGENEETFELLAFDQRELTVRHGHNRLTVSLFSQSDTQLSLATSQLEFAVTDIAAGEAADDAGGDGTVIAPMHGQLLEILVSEGDQVTTGQRLAVLEAMKMQHEILAPVSGTISEILAAAGTQVALDAVLLTIEKDQSEVS